jgi:histone deacetylase 1/2
LARLLDLVCTHDVRNLYLCAILTILEIPYNDYYEYYGPDYQLEVRPSNMQNANSKEYLDRIRTTVLENLSRTKFAPSVQMTDVPRDAPEEEPEEDTEESKDMRGGSQEVWDSNIQKDGELSDSEDEGEGGRRDIRNYKDEVGDTVMMDLDEDEDDDDTPAASGKP